MSSIAVGGVIVPGGESLSIPIVSQSQQSIVQQIGIIHGRIWIGPEAKRGAGDRGQI